MAVNEQGHYGKYSGNARCCMGHPHTRVDRYNYKPTERDDAAHISYLKRDIIYDAHHGHDDEKMVADEKHISKLAGDMKYDKKHHGPGKHISSSDPMEGHYGTHFEADRQRMRNKAMNKAAGMRMKASKAASSELVEEGSSAIIEGAITSRAGSLGRAAGMKAAMRGPKKALVGDQHELPEHLQQAILDAPGKHCFCPSKYAYDSPSKRYCIK